MKHRVGCLCRVHKRPAPLPLVPGYTSRGARLLQAVMKKHGHGPALVNVAPAAKKETP